jgi:hypothetical protein
VHFTQFYLACIAFTIPTPTLPTTNARACSALDQRVHFTQFYLACIAFTIPTPTLPTTNARACSALEKLLAEQAESGDTDKASTDSHGMKHALKVDESDGRRSKRSK